MKFPPRDAYRIRPPFEVPAQKPRRLVAGAIFVAGFAIAVLGAFHEVSSTGKEPTTHLQPYSPLPTAGSFQVLGNPARQPSPSETPSPTAVLQLHQQVQPTPTLTVATPPPVQVWSSANVLTPTGLEPVAAVVAAPPAADPPAAVIATPTPTPEPSSMPTPTPQPSASPTPTPRPSPTPTPTPQPSTTPTPQPSPSGSPSCVPTRRHPCQSREG